MSSVEDAVKDGVSAGTEAAGKLAEGVVEAKTAVENFVSGDGVELLEAAKDHVQDGIELGKDVAEVVGTEGGKILGVAGEVLQEEGGKIVEKGGEIMGAAKDIMQDGGETIAKTAGDVHKFATEGVGTIKKGIIVAYNSPEAQQIIGDSFGPIFEGAKVGYTLSMEAAEQGMRAAAGIAEDCVENVFPLLKFEIFRDFTQVASVVFREVLVFVSDVAGQIGANIYNAMVNAFNAVYSFFAVDFFPLLRQPIVVQWTVIIVMILSVLYIIAFVFVIFYGSRQVQPRMLRDGQEAESWKDLSKRRSKFIKFMGYLITIALSIYLPVAQYSIMIVAGTGNIVETSWGLSQVKSANTARMLNATNSTSNSTQTKYYVGKEWADIFLYASIFMIITFVIPLPIVFYFLIQKNKPRGSVENPDITYDVDGEEIPFDDKEYARRLENDPDQRAVPYASLYKGFERKWAYYKVIILIFKLALLLAAMAAVHSPLLKSIILTVVGSLFCFMSFYSSPFIDPNNDRMDACGRVTSVFTMVCGLVGILVGNKLPAVTNILGVLVGVANVLNGLSMFGFFLGSTSWFRMWMKNYYGHFTLNDTTLRIKNGDVDLTLKEWDLDKEKKHRVWHSFWNSVLLQLCDQEVAERFVSLEHITQNFGIKRIKEHWNGFDVAEIRDAREKAIEIEGVDVFFDDKTACLDGHLDSQTCFGKMWIKRYPFHCVMVYDDASDETLIWNSHIVELIEKNNSPEIKDKIQLRKELRAVGLNHASVHWPFSRMETASVEDGQETYTDSEGHEQTRTRYSTVQFECYYTNGAVHISAETSKAFSAGYNFKMKYVDGKGTAVAPHTGKHHHISGRHADMGGDHIGLNKQFTRTQKMQQFLNSRDVPPLIQKNLPSILQAEGEYRKTLKEKHEAKVKTISDGFWYYIYNDHSTTREQLELYLTNEERNPILQQFPTKHADGLDFLYKRMRYASSHPVLCLWYVFWDSFFAENSGMKVIKPMIDDFDPSKATSICYQYKEREDLEAWLKERNILTSGGFCDSKYFTPKHLDAFYERIEAEKAKIAEQAA